MILKHYIDRNFGFAVSAVTDKILRITKETFQDDCHRSYPQNIALNTNALHEQNHATESLTFRPSQSFMC